MSHRFKKFRFTFNSPVILGFFLVCLIVYILDKLSAGTITTAFFSVYRSSLMSPLTYVRFFGHVLGHSTWNHLFGNMMLFLVIGPMLEEKYGSLNILLIIVGTAFVTGLTHFVFFPSIKLLGASGIVFAFILLASLTSLKDGEIPITFILVALLYLGKQVFDGVFLQDNVSNLTHILGGIVGSIIGYYFNKNAIRRR